MGLPHAIYMTTANITDRSGAINMVEYGCNVKKSIPSPENSDWWRLYQTKFRGYNPRHFKGRGWGCKAKWTPYFFCFSETLDCIAHLRLAWQISPTLEKLREIPSKLISDDCSCLYSYYLQKILNKLLYKNYRQFKQRYRFRLVLRLYRGYRELSPKIRFQSFCACRS